MNIGILEYIAMLASISGNFFVNRKKVVGMQIWLAGSLMWMGIALHNESLPQFILFTVYTYFNIDGYLKWRS